jgi:hypothetical protein
VHREAPWVPPPLVPQGGWLSSGLDQAASAAVPPWPSGQQLDEAQAPRSQRHDRATGQWSLASAHPLGRSGPVPGAAESATVLSLLSGS